MNDFAAIARQWWNSVLKNVLNTQTVEIYFHRSPGIDNGGDRAISGLHWRVMAQGFDIQHSDPTGAGTGNDGKIDMDIRGGVSTLQLMHNNTVVAEYEVRVSTAALDAVGTLRGQKQRLRLLGYQIGHAGPDGNGVDVVPNPVMKTERSVLDFRTDQGMLSNADVDANTQNALTTEAGNL